MVSNPFLPVDDKLDVLAKVVVDSVIASKPFPLETGGFVSDVVTNSGCLSS